MGRSRNEVSSWHTGGRETSNHGANGRMREQVKGWGGGGKETPVGDQQGVGLRGDWGE